MLITPEEPPEAKRGCPSGKKGKFGKDRFSYSEIQKWYNITIVQLWCYQNGMSNIITKKRKIKH